MISPVRWSAAEYSDSRFTLHDVAAATKLQPADIRLLVDAAGERAARSLGMGTSPISIRHDRIRIEDIAGIVRLAPQIELEIAPKFLGCGEGAAGWREDLFYLATLSRYGKLLPAERLRASSSKNRDLPTLLARSMIDTYERNRRRPLRTYHRSIELAFSLDGDFDAETLIFPSPDGFEQEVVTYDRRNQYNAAIRAAALRLSEEVRDSGIKSQVERVAASLYPQDKTDGGRRARVPGRSRSWQDIYDLSNDVLRGFGLVYEPKTNVRSPGYLIRTWQLWEDFVGRSLRIGFSGYPVHLQKDTPLGTRFRKEHGGVSRTPVMVTPDASILLPERGDKPLLLDAKYKTRVEYSRQRISEADIYEALAFARASEATTVMLLYPAVASLARKQVGEAILFELVCVDNIKIHALQLEVRGISANGAMTSFADNLRTAIIGVLDSA